MCTKRRSNTVNGAKVVLPKTKCRRDLSVLGDNSDYEPIEILDYSSPKDKLIRQQLREELIKYVNNTIDRKDNESIEPIRDNDTSNNHSMVHTSVSDAPEGEIKRYSDTEILNKIKAYSILTKENNHRKPFREILRNAFSLLTRPSRMYETRRDLRRESEFKRKIMREELIRMSNELREHSDFKE